MRLDTALHTPRQLSEAQITEMLRLMETYYENVVPERFRSDLEEKHWVILLTRAGCVVGFSTQMVLDLKVAGRDVRAVFSGDTIIDRSCWGSQTLPIEWGRLMIAVQREWPDRPLYWILTTKGFRTYRFLPVFFRDYHPSPGKPLPTFERLLIRAFAETKCPGRFDREAGVLRAGPGDQRLRSGVGEITVCRRTNRSIDFFERANPGHSSGDELICAASFEEKNLKPYIWKRLIH